MSHSFYVALDEAPDYETVFEAIRSEDLESAEGVEELPGQWCDGHVIAVWRHGVSTRPVELAWENDSFSARILTCSCPEDYTLALDAVCAVAKGAGVDIESEEGVRFAPRNRKVDVSKRWIGQHVDSMVSMVLTAAVDAEPYATLPGPTRSFYIGPDVAEEISGLPRSERRDALFEKMRAVFYPAEDVYPSKTIVLKRDDGSTSRVAVLGPDVHYIFSPVDSIQVIADDPIEVPFEDLEALVGEERVQYLDEANVLVEAIADRDWDDIVARAEELGVTRAPSTPRRPAPPRARSEFREEQEGRAMYEDSGPSPWLIIRLILFAIVVLLSLLRLAS